MRTLVWMALVATTSAVMVRITVRALEQVWRRATKQDPPQQPLWARFVVGRTMKLAARPS